MFLSYIGRELRRRRRQAFVVSLGLALGIGLVVTISAMASGVRQAQSTVLQSLYGVGTDITVTRSAAQGSAPRGGFRVGPSKGRFKRDQITTSPGLASFDASEASRMASLPGVSVAAGGLSLTAIHINGKLPTLSVGPSSGTVVTSPSAQSSTPGRIDVSTYSIEGVDVGHANLGPIAAGRVTRGRSFTAADAHADVAVVDRSYARQRGLAVGDTITIDGTDFTVVGLITPSAQGAGSDVYVPLAKAQALAGEKGQINRVYVKATGSGAIGTAKRSIKRAYPKDTVTTASDLAAQVTGSLSSASNLAAKLGTWLSIAALVGAILIASLLTLSSVGRRVRELGTLKALGWRTRRVVGQVIGETFVQGLIGGALGIGLGFGGAWLVTRVAPSLTASVSAFPGRSAFLGGPPGSGGRDPFSHAVSVALHAPVSATLVGLAIGLSLLGGLLVGLVGGWRAARMRPSDAMRRVA
jgi:ABC-type antimicrobial peptide transport system permease subunit